LNKVKILFFASLKERAGVKEASLELPEGAQVQELKAALLERFPGLGPAVDTMVVSVNQEFAYDEEAVPPGAEVAVFPPVSGGSGAAGAGDSGSAPQGNAPQAEGMPAGSSLPTLFAITESTLDLDDLLAQITLPTTGAACIFTGMVRGITTRGDPHKTTHLEYEAYRPMAEAKMRQVAEEIRRRWPSVEGIAIVQRIGRLAPGTPTVLIGCTAPHRDTGVFEAARYGIDRLKEIVPVWKKEVGPDGQTWVEGEYLPRPGE
jgi:molybdopterin synthase catalytic subunit